MGPVLESPPTLPAGARPLSGQTAQPLTETHFQVIRQAVAARRPVQKAARVARGSALTLLVIAALGLPLALAFPGWLAWLMVGGIGIIGMVEYVGAGRMRKGLPSAAGLLGLNQLALLVLVSGYCLFQMAGFWSVRTESGLLPTELRGQLSAAPEVAAQLDQALRVWTPPAVIGFYLLVIILSAAVQGGMAFYYFTRKRHLEQALAITPGWVSRLFAELGV